MKYSEYCTRCIDEPVQKTRIVITPESEPWRNQSSELTDWVLSHLVNRTDIHGQYTDNGAQFTCKKELTRTKIDRHFRPFMPGHIIGLHTTRAQEIEGPGGEMIVSCTSRWCTNDIDYHGEGDAPAINWAGALRWHERAISLGFHPLLVDSNGHGGFRNFIIFRDPVQTVLLFHLIRWLQRDWAELGFADPPEAFPKQPHILVLNDPEDAKGKCGNWVRLFARHPKREHYSRFWDGDQWLEGGDAVDFLLDHTGDDPALIPAEVHDLVKAGRSKPKPPPNPAANGPAHESNGEATPSTRCRQYAQDAYGRIIGTLGNNKGAGARHDYATQTSNVLASMVKAGWISEQECLDGFKAAAIANGMGVERFKEIDELWRSAYDRVTPHTSEHIESVPDESDEDTTDPIGKMDDAAFLGPLGELAKLTQPETEANRAFVLAHLLTFAGVYLGYNPHFIVSATRHRLNLYIGAVGPTYLGRKGMAGDVAKEIFSRIAPLFAQNHIDQGLNSGAGLLWKLRDAMYAPDKSGGEDICVDPGVSDKRRIFLEPEFSSVLKQANRDGNPLTEHLRMFYDGMEKVGSAVRTDPLTVTRALVGLIGHITPADVTDNLKETDKINGFGNRPIWLYGVRWQILPRGGNVFKLLETGPLQEVIRIARMNLKEARNLDEITRTPEAEELWDSIYRAPLPPGNLGAIVARRAPNIMRLACIYMASTGFKEVEVGHIEAALAFMDYSLRSCRFIFECDVNPDAEKLLEALKVKPEGLTMREIHHDVFSGHKTTKELGEILKTLLAEQRIKHVPKAYSGKGRPSGGTYILA